MFCDQCGKELQEGHAYCSNCGKQVGSLSPPRPSRLARHLGALGVLWIVWAVCWFLGAAVLMGVAHFIMGPLVHARMPAGAEELRGLPEMVMTLAAGSLIVLGIASAVAGWGLTQRYPWARIVTLVMAFLSLFTFPLGTALGVYTLWVLLSAEAGEEYDRLSGM